MTTGVRTLRAATLLIALSVPAAALTGCSSTPPDPFSAPACTQLPAAAIRAAVTDLATVGQGPERTGPHGSEYGSLPATNDNGRSYDCAWPTTTPDKQHSSAFAVTVEALDPVTFAELTRSVMQDLPGQSGQLLTSATPGQGRAFVLDGSGQAVWLCPRTPGAYTSQRLRVDVFRPSHPDHPADDAKTLAEAIIPLIGCSATTPTAGSTTTATTPAAP